MRHRTADARYPKATADAKAQFARFIAVRGVANVLYAVLFVVLADLGSEAANLVGAVASSVLANELHRRLTFHADGRVGWFRAQWEGGGIALAGIVATSLTLARFEALAPGSGALAHLAVVALVTGAVGLVLFAGLRWMFGATAAPTLGPRLMTVCRSRSIGTGAVSRCGSSARPDERPAKAHARGTCGTTRDQTVRKSSRCVLADPPAVASAVPRSSADSAPRAGASPMRTPWLD